MLGLHKTFLYITLGAGIAIVAQASIGSVLNPLLAPLKLSYTS